MHDNPIAFGTVRNGILTLSGYGCSLTVQSGALRVQDGMASDRCDVRYHRATCGITRVVILSHSGTISLDAIRWLHDIGASLMQIDRDGTILLASAPLRADYPALRRAQALAAHNETGPQIMRDIIRTKLLGQAAVLQEMGMDDRAAIVTQHSNELDHAGTMTTIRLLESQAATVYWTCWEVVPMPFARRDAAKVASHWRTFGIRTSPLTRSPRRAATPGNALLNYVYAILEAEARIALLRVGLDPGLGLLHADQPSRDSLALDLMEAVRPDVDRWLYQWLQSAHLSARDFFETRDGTVRVLAPLTVHLTATAARWATALGPFAERVAAKLVRPETRLPTPLTETNRRAGRRHSQEGQLGVPKAANLDDSPGTCVECGELLQSRRRRFCSDECRKRHHCEVVVPQFAASGVTALAERRAAGDDPAHGGEAKEKRVASKEKRAKERAAWEAKHGDGHAERERFVAEILPKLGNIPLSQIVEATGFSLRYASLVRSSQYVPHPVHYLRLRRLVDNVG